jgi:hypothetical protein
MTEATLINGPRRLRPSVLLFLTGMLLLNGAFAFQVRTLLREGYSDFAIFYCAGKIVNLGLGRHLYDERVQYEVQPSFAPRVSIRKGPLPYNHPPFEALLFAPLARFPYFIAFLCWDFLNLAVLVALPLILRPHVALLESASAFWFVLASLAFFPIWTSLIQGQDAVLFLLLMTVAYVALKRTAEFDAGCWLGLCVFRFHLILPLMLVFLLRRKLKTVLGFALVSAVLGLISVAVVGWHEAMAYPRYLWQIESLAGGQAIFPREMPNLRGLLVTALSSHLSQTAIGGLVAMCSLALLYFVSLKWKPGADIDLPCSLCLVSSVLTNYHSYIYDLGVLFLASLLVVNHRLIGGDSKWRAAKLYGPVFLLFFSPLEMALQLRYDRFYFYSLVLILWGWGISGEISEQRTLSGDIARSAV